MKRIRLNMQIFLCASAGILLGTALCNRIFESGLVSYAVLFDGLERTWQDAAGSVFVRKTIIVRLLETAGLIVLAGSHLQKLLIWLYSFWMGMYVSTLLTVLTWNRGIFGILYFLACIFPHMLIYPFAWGLLILRYRAPYEIYKWKFWCVMVLLIGMGFLAEIFLNPLLLRLLTDAGTKL